MAPEQVAARPDLDHRVDIYAVGVMAYEMLSGTRPFPGATPQAVFVAQSTMTPTPLEQLRPGIPPLLSQIVTRCLAARPADRWQTADELLAQLERVRITGEDATTPAGVTPVPGTPSAGRPAAGTTSRHRAVAWGIAAALATVAGIAVVLASRHADRPMRLGGRTPLTVDPGIEADPAISPDGQLGRLRGRRSERRAHLRPTDGRRAADRGRAGRPGPQRMPYWSPDGKRLVFRSSQGLEADPGARGDGQSAGAARRRRRAAIGALVS